MLSSLLWNAAVLQISSACCISLNVSIRVSITIIQKRLRKKLHTFHIQKVAATNRNDHISNHKKYC